jgi:hypothetical protein
MLSRARQTMSPYAEPNQHAIDTPPAPPCSGPADHDTRALGSTPGCELARAYPSIADRPAGAPTQGRTAAHAGEGQGGAAELGGGPMSLEKIKLLEPSAPPSVWGRGRETIPPAPPIEGQTTVDEMLASCPQCAGELRPFSFGDLAEHSVAIGTMRCVDCGWVREPAGADGHGR